MFKTFYKALIAIAVTCTCFTAFALSEQKTSAIKVAYLYYFTKFVSWPDDVSFANKQVNLCTGNVSEQIEFQLSTIDGKKVGERSLKVHYLRTLEGQDDKSQANPQAFLSACHILYVSPGLIEWFADNSHFTPAHTLVVAESDEIKNGVIHLHMLNNKLSFEINNQLAGEKSLKISSKLLKLSRRRVK